MSKPRLLDAWTTAEFRAKHTIIKAQAGIIDALEAELEDIKTRGREAILGMNTRLKSFMAGLSWVEAERDYYKRAYEEAITLFRLHGGGGKLTKLRANWIIDFLMSIDGREYGMWKANGKRFLTVDEVQELLTHEIDDVLKLRPDLKRPRLAAANVCKRVLKEAALRGIPIKQVSGRLGSKYLIIEYTPGGKPAQLEQRRPRGRPGKGPEAIRAALQAGRKPAAWAANYTGFHRAPIDPGGG